MFSRGEILPETPKNGPAKGTPIDVRDSQAERLAAAAEAQAQRERELKRRQHLLMGGIALGVVIFLGCIVLLIINHEPTITGDRIYGVSGDGYTPEVVKVQDRVVMPGACVQEDEHGSCSVVVEYNVIWRDLKLSDAFGKPQGDFASGIGSVAVTAFRGNEMTVTVTLSRAATKDLDVWLETTSNRNGHAEYSRNLAFKAGDISREITIPVPVRVQGYGRMDYRPVILTANLSNVDPFIE